MVDREKVISGLRFCFDETLGIVSCDGCVYSDSKTFKNGVTHCYLVDDAIELLKEQEAKTGEWIPVTNGRGGMECSICHDYAPSYQNCAEYLSKYCPNCGAKMEGR